MKLEVFTSYGRGGGSARVRVFDWLDFLGLRAIEHRYLDANSSSPRDLFRDPKALIQAELDLARRASGRSEVPVFVSRQASPLSSGRLEVSLLRGAVRGVYDFDDALYLKLASRGPTSLFPKSRIWERAVGAADVVIAGNEVLADAASELSSNVTVIPSCVDARAYSPKADYSAAPRPVAVWIGSPSTETFLLSISSALLTAHRERGLRLKVISAGARSLGDLDVMTDRVDWSMNSFVGHLRTSDFGIMPLDDTPWARGKCAYKLLQYGACALPMIGTPVGANSAVLRDCDGLAAVSVNDWAEALLAMCDESSSQRSLRGAAGRDTVQRLYSFEAWKQQWLLVVLGES